jgi:hypothetical protein
MTDPFDLLKPFNVRDRMRMDATAGVIITDAAVITGTRTWEDGQKPDHDPTQVQRNWKTIARSFIEHLPPDTLVITGGASGVDWIAYDVARHYHYPRLVMPYFGHWGTFGGPMRNGAMLALAMGLQARYGTRIRLMAYHDEHPDRLKKGSGTRDCWIQAQHFAIPSRHFPRR